MSLTATPPLAELENAAEFVARHIGPEGADEARMLSAIGAASREALISALVPRNIVRGQAMAIPDAVTEAKALAELKAVAGKNKVLKSFIGQGYHGTITPGVILRNILENPAWYTAYTPYQAEISQGRMEALLNFQTMVTDLTGMAIANASMLDEATAAAEAMTLAQRMGKSKSKVFFVADDVLPQTLEVVQTRAKPLGIEVVVGGAEQAGEKDCFAALFQYPGVTGQVRVLKPVVDAVHAHGGLVIVAADLLALTLLQAPAEFGADIACGNTQRLGMPMGCGGPHAAYLATQDALKRSLPGRLVGVSVDTHGAPAYRLALQTREQHIRREKATSNICTAQVLPAVIASMYAVYHGPAGLRRIARRVASFTAIFAAGLAQRGLSCVNAHAFDTIEVATGPQTEAVLARAVAAGMNLRRASANTVSVSFDECTTRACLTTLWGVFAPGQALPSFDEFEQGVVLRLPAELLRSSDFLTHPVFNTHHSETEMLRYIRRLSDKDLALDRSMIPLGSCTMKLNATSEMIPITWPEFAHVHPFAPADQLEGYRLLNDQLCKWLEQATGYAGISLQPNAGSQGEYAGLLVIKAWHASRGEGARDVCLIPESAHGTNPASAQMVGMKVVVVKCTAEGEVDMADLEAKCVAHKDDLAAMMITYPSTYGVFEPGVKALCALVHQYGGRVYVDGANMNAMVGVAAPGEFGGDVSHLNLHKTFCIPHGGGGPGMGPIAVAEHLAPFLPGHPVVRTVGTEAIGPVSAAPWGSASILTISWIYIALMNGSGLTRASEVAILSANYMAARLAPHYPVLFSGERGRVAHEFILDLRPWKSVGVEAEDVAKRLMDYGFHAPTMSFPVAGTLMIEPTESESRAELDRLVDALIAIREEIRAIEEGRMDAHDNPLKRAPHTAEEVTATEWNRPYSREQAAFPAPWVRENKFWPYVGRVDNVWGDRNLLCSCPPTSSYG